jgi:hypothetical protein
MGDFVLFKKLKHVKIVSMNSSDLISSVIDFLIFVSPALAVVILAIILFNSWVMYARSKFFSEQEYVLLRITPPRDVFKTPAAMELFINGLYQTVGEATLAQKYWKGSVRPWFSLEIASSGGNVGFYLWTKKGMTRYLESQLYSQYPGIEVREVEDYTSKVDYESGDYSLWAAEFKLAEPDPIPIKTYIDYDLQNSAVDEESKVDPITPMLEFMGSIRPGEFVWLQIIVRAHVKDSKDPESFLGFKKIDKWAKDSKEEIKKIREDSMFEADGKDGEKHKVPLATKGQSLKVEAIERSQGKLPFDTGIRGIYIAEKDLFDGVNIGGLIGSFKQFSSASLNGFKLGITTATKWWQDPFGKNLKAMKTEMFEAYKAREYFYRPFFRKQRKHFVLNSEELATIFHFPGSVAGTPTLERVQSKKSDAPTNLPI